MSKRTFDSEIENNYKTNFDELETQGYTVIEGVVPADVCAKSFESILNFLREANISARIYDSDGGCTPNHLLQRSEYPNSHGIIQHLGIGHDQGIWDIRTHEGVTDVFEHLYGDNDLLVSFDGACFMPAHWRDSGKSQLHTDQSHKRLGLRCIQGYINLLTSHDERSGSLVVVPGSHLKHSEYASTHAEARENPDDWYRYTNEEIAEFGTPIRVHGGVGSLVLWDSRTAHNAREPPNNVLEARERCVVYVCYQPRKFIKPVTLKRKIEAFLNHRMTTHWPASRVILFPLTWRTWGKPVKVKTPTPNRRENDRMKELAGVTHLTTRKRRTWTPALTFIKDN